MVKKGFSLAEALVVMAIISVFFAAASKVVTVKRPAPKFRQPHGYYECFINCHNDYYQQRYFRDGVESTETTGNTCTFEPPIGASGFNIYGYGRYFSVNKFYSVIDKPFRMRFEEDNHEPKKRKLRITFYDKNGEISSTESIKADCTNNCFIGNPSARPTVETIELYYPDIYRNHMEGTINEELYTGIIISW